MTMMYMYSGLPLVQYFPWPSAAFASQCNGQTCLLRPHSNWEEYCLNNGHKVSGNCPTSVLTDQQGGDFNGAVRRGEGDGKREASTEDCTFSSPGGTAASSSRPEDGRSSTAKDNTQLKFGIDKILGNNYVSATKTTENKSSDKPEYSSNDANERSKRDWEAVSPLTACAAWRNTTYEAGTGTGFTSRRTEAHHPHARHSVVGTALQLPGKFSSTSSYQDLSSIMLHGTDQWSYSQYRLDHHSSLHPTEREEPLPADLPTHPKQPHHQTILNSRVVGGGRRKRSWSRAVFTSLQRKGLEKRFGMQKYVNKPDRRQLAAALGLTDAQVKVWFQNRRMKWRHSQRVQKQQRQQAADTSTECPAFASAAESGTDGEDEAVDRDLRPAASRKDAPLDRDRLGSQDGLILNAWTPK